MFGGGDNRLAEAHAMERKNDEPFDYRERAKEELFLDPEGAAFKDGPGEVMFGNHNISALLTPADFKNEFTLGKENVAWRAKFPAKFEELCFGKRNIDNKPIKLKYWKPDGYSQEELKICHKVLIDGEPFDPQIVDHRWSDGAPFHQENEKEMARRNGSVRASHGFFPPFNNHGEQCNEIWNADNTGEDPGPDGYFNGGLLLMGDGLDPAYKKHWHWWYPQAMLQRKLTPGSSHEITVEVYLWLLAAPETVGMVPEETWKEKAAWVRDPQIAQKHKQRGDFKREIFGDGMIPLPITQCLARGTFTLHVPADLRPTGLMPRYPKGLSNIKEGPIVAIEKSMNIALEAFVRNNQSYAKEIFLTCNIVNDKGDVNAETFTEDDVWQYQTYNEKERQTDSNGREVTITRKKERWVVNGLAYFYRRPGVWKDDDTHCQTGIVMAAFSFVGSGNQKALPVTAWGHDAFLQNVPVDILTDEDKEISNFKP
ncbi:hypothetical protein HOP50_09g56200 [Chloropicon primus]|uniref:Uncharacterized protein n=1 Tax=Chloropicon primus TaxID=1764295 RepID=A0A5B8MUH1_9CHLO|nr:hypothetical protein A3770_09p55980 [Chloropicon primus]UPR02294.1 hypothetical protein HOP50_09g56200 [Chloropicon primus]|eukprot:QDZ23080.1 hypothetical protein A3770_09p55980 [Chloropicon primus]